MTQYCLTASPSEPIIVYYCKAGIQTGRTIRVLQNGIVKETAAVEMTDAVPSKAFVAEFHATMSHDNSTGKAKRSGARCVLTLHSGAIHFAA